MVHSRQLLFGLVFFILLYLPYNIHAQKSTYVPGEFIIQTNGASPHEVLVQSLSTDRRQKTSVHAIDLSSEMGLYKIAFDTVKVNEIELLSKLKTNPNVLAVQRNHYLKPRRVPNDPRYEEQWPLRSNNSVHADIEAEAAWDVTTGGKISNTHDIVIAVIDDGFHVDHPDLIENLYVNENEIPNNGIDDDQNGYIDDYRGWSFKTNNDSLSTGDHGEPVAGVIGARGNNGIGITGINWDVKILPLLLDEKFTDAGLLASYIYAYKLRKRFNESQGAQGAFVAVTNSSWGAEGYFPDEFPVWCNFYDSLSTVGILNCVATSNGNVNVDVTGDIPSLCSSESVVVVTNTDINRNLVGAYGPKNVDIAAPGEDIFTLKNDGYGFESGTSFSAPVVSGVLGLMYSVPVPGILDAVLRDPEGTAHITKNLMLQSYDYVSALDGKIKVPGIINARKAVESMMAYFNVENIDYCTIDSLTNSSYFLDSLIIGSEVIASGNNLGYRPHSFLTDSLEQGRYIPVSLVSNTYTDSLDFVLWLDQNRDSVFSDSEVLVNSRDVARWDGEFFMPERLDSGYYNIRVGVLATTDSINPCGTDIPSYEYEDYTVYVKLNPLLCQNSPAVDTIMTGPDYLQIMWEEVDSSVAYVFRYRKQGDTEWEDEMVDTSKMFTLDDLDECTPYEFQVRSVCFYDTSAYTPVAVFFTACISSNENQEFAESIKVFPNPSHGGNLTVDFRNTNLPIGQSAVSVTLYSMEGRQMKTEQRSSLLSDQLHLYWPDVPRGMYLVRIDMDGRFAVKKWMIH
ncbi:S8 family serine peptidase [Membranicola marinus]|uniref:S8 family serine peptidase n=1 Tax=Membranihabitans marinus TaxID=1227546 RepID=A0A953HWX9_9BACT|nr:S8 family serine peptidase [Membranihabitans marinus]MBY5957272.1 S8 family serine peptidase [Membranihabitans marinus]